MLVALFA